MLSLWENQWKKNPEKIKNIYRWLLYTKYKAENNALWTIDVKYCLQIYWEVWKFESAVFPFSMEKNGIFKWKMYRNPE